MIREGINLYFSDPRLMMSPGGRFLVRFVSYFVYAILIAACAIFLLADIKWIFWSGVLLLLFLSERLINLNKGERSLQQKKLRGDVNLAKYLSPPAFMAVEYSFERASVLGGSFCLFLLKRLINGRGIKTGLIRMGINSVEFLNKVDDVLGKSLKNNNNSGSKEDRKKYLLAEVQKIISISLEEAFNLHNGFIDPSNIFTALSYCDDPGILKVFQFFNIEQGDLENALIFSRFNHGFVLSKFLPSNLGGFARNPYKNRHRIMNRAWSARPTPTLDKYSEDLTDYAREESIGFLIGHRNEYDRMIDVLSRQGRPNVLLNGEPGSGKDTIVEHLAFRIAKDEVPPELFDKRLVKLRLSNVVAGADQSEFQARLKKIIEEIIQAGNIVFFP
ncbi:MAG: ATP-dependent Clp protease ATP-binding subunit ClpC [Parcubacteria group bacterium Athens1014_26]|nr:MAG: ATP-dependent Clp protease ATP-binding subunit ClpC [Parcubacteria group bacterium Athens1014_26]